MKLLVKSSSYKRNWKVIVKPKASKDSSWYVLYDHLTEAQAIKECDSWGWMYDDGRITYYMDVTDEDTNNFKQLKIQ